MLQPLASGEAVLAEDEKELGRRLVDIGGGTTDIAIFSDGRIVHTAVIALGGNNLTTTSPSACARRPTRPSGSSRSYGCALASMVDEEETIEVPSVGGRAAAGASGRQILCEIIEPRVEEIFQLVQREIQKCGFEDLLASGRGDHRRLDAARRDARAGRGGARPAGAARRARAASAAWSTW